MSMNQQLRDLYEHRRADLIALRREFPQTSWPHLIQVSPAYEQAERRLLIVGKQTDEWKPEDAEAARWEADLEGRLIDGLLRHYADSFPPFRPSPFWRAVKQIRRSLLPGGPEDGFAWLNLLKVDQDRGRPPAPVEEAWCRRFPVLPEELQILKPHWVIFFTGPVLDKRLPASLPGARLLPVDGCGKAIRRVEAPGLLPYHAYRSYHPMFLQLRSQWERIEQLIALCRGG